MIVEFDEKGIVTQYRVIPDSALVKEFPAWLSEANAPSLNLCTPVRIQVQHHHQKKTAYEDAEMFLGQDFVQFHELGAGQHDFKVSPQKISGLSLAGLFARDLPDPQFINETLHFTEKTKPGKNATFKMDVPTLIVLIQYMKQSNIDFRFARCRDCAKQSH